MGEYIAYPHSLSLGLKSSLHGNSDSSSNFYIKACVQNKAQLYASSALSCISGYVLSDKEKNQNINKQLCWINLATVVAGLMKSKLTESQHIDICKPINLLNKKWGDKNPPQTTKLNI